jgi:hypothetical protein
MTSQAAEKLCWHGWQSWILSGFDLSMSHARKLSEARGDLQLFNLVQRIRG